MRRSLYAIRYNDEGPVTQLKLEQAAEEIQDLGEQPFEVVKVGVQRVETRQSRIARSAAFREQVRREYGLNVPLAIFSL